MAYKLELDVLKALSIIAVVIIHTLSGFNVPLAESSLFLTINQLARFSVPLFVFLSGYGLAAKYQSQSLTFSEFVNRRILKLIPLYAFWSIFTYVLIRLYSPWSSAAEHLSLLEALLFGKADYQLYFVPMIFQLYLIFPLLRRIMLAASPFLIFFLSVFVQLASFRVMNALSLSDQVQYTFAITWLGYFVLGVAVGMRAFRRFIRTRYLVAIFGLLILITSAWMVSDSLWLIQGGSDVLDATRFTRDIVFIYATLAILLLFILRHYFLKLPEVVSRTVGFIGKHAYLIFLSHTLLLRLVIDLYRGTTNFFTWMLMLVACLLALGISPRIARLKV